MLAGLLAVEDGMAVRLLLGLGVDRRRYATEPRAVG
jgi:hypothetical protein